MVWTELHARILASAFEKVLGVADEGAMAFVRCLTPIVIEAMGRDANFAPSGWQVQRVAAEADPTNRTITADQAVEIRESKGQAVLLLVDTSSAGAGMDGIYSAAREVNEAALFAEALSQAGREVTRRLSRQARGYAELAIRKARGFAQRLSVSPWTAFDFIIRVAAEERQPGELLYLLGLWPVEDTEESNATDTLDLSRLFVDRLLGTAVSGLTPAQRIEALKLLDPTEEQITDLARFLRSAATKPLLPALTELSDKKHLWVYALRIETIAHSIHSIELVPWRTNTGKVAKWSGLIEDPQDAEEPPILLLDPQADRTGNYSKLEVRWKARPENLDAGAVTYRVTIVTDMDEEIASREVSHVGKKEEKARFSNDDFSTLSEDALINAKVVVLVIGNEGIEPQESEEFKLLRRRACRRGTRWRRKKGPDL